MSNHDPAISAQAAHAAGLPGFGTYPRSGFMHFDLGPARSWGEPFQARAAPFVLELATLGAAGIEVAQDVLPETKSAILPLASNLDTLRCVFIPVALIGTAIHARIADWKRGQR